MTSQTTVGDNEIDLSHALAANEKICATAPFFVVVAENDGSITGEMITGLTVAEGGKKLTGTISQEAGTPVFVDFYVLKKANQISELQIDAENFAGYYYVEAATLFREQSTGRDLPAELTFPNVKIQSNFTFTMASTGDPSTFTFTMDAFPGYTYFNPSKKVLCAMQILEDAEVEDAASAESVFPHNEAAAALNKDLEDSVPAVG